jgi:secondary thiamine-phosphate synthase enzyme
MIKEIALSTHARLQMLPIDREVEAVVAESGVAEGTCMIWVPHTTAGVTVNENADPSVIRDILYATGKVFPNDDTFHHVEGNSDAHVKSSLFGPSLTLLVAESRLVLGTWQSVYFCEFDGPRERRYYVKVTAD